MATISPNLFVSVVDHTALVKITGRANFASSVTFKTLIQELNQRGFDKLILELSQCVTMDSTFLGVLAGLALRSKDGPGYQAPLGSDLQLLNANQRIIDLLQNLGVSHLFRITQCPPPVSNGAETPYRSTEATREELSSTCLEAHRLLMQINPENIPKFKEVTQFLAEDLKKLKAEPGS